jgi:hypothetical protein
MQILRMTGDVPPFLHGMHGAALPVTVFVDFVDEVKQGCSTYSLQELRVHDTVLRCLCRHWK